MKKTLFTLVLFTSINVLAQESLSKENVDIQISALKENISSVQSHNYKLENEIRSLNSKLSTVNSKLQKLESLVQSNGVKILETNSDLTTTNQKFTQVDNSLSKNSLWSIIGVLGAIIVSALVYWLVSKRQATDKTDVEAQITKTKKTLEEEGVKLDTKLTEVLETQLKLIQAERANMAANKSEEIDHSLALKVADEIVRINKNLSNMDADTKGLKQLSASVKRIEDNFAANGYDMPELLNKPFDPRMKMLATMIEDDNLGKEVEIITKIIKPQVNYKGIQIQSAQVEVSVGQ